MSYATQTQTSLNETGDDSRSEFLAFDSDYFIGLGTLSERMQILVDIDKLMSSSEMGLLEEAAA